MRRLLSIFVLAACSAPAAAQVTWDDPTLAHAVRSSDLIVLAKATAVAENGAAYVVVRTLKGPDRSGDVLAVTGLHNPELSRRPPIAVGDLAYLVLRGDPKGEGFTLPTPTFGRFVRKKGGGRDRVVMSMGGPDTFARIAVSPRRFEELVRGLATGSGAALLGECRETISDPSADPSQLYLALEIVAELGQPSDAPRALSVLRAKRHRGRGAFRVRAAATKVMGRLGGTQAVRHLLERVEKDPEPCVKSVAASLIPEALGTTDSGLRVFATRKLAALALELDWEPIRFGAADDPRRNFVPSPLASALTALATLKAGIGTRPALRALEREHAESIQAGLDYFEGLGDAQKVGAIARRMRPAGSKDAFINRVFARTLARLTGEDLGDRRQDWLDWWDVRRADSPKVGPGE